MKNLLTRRYVFSAFAAASLIALGSVPVYAQAQYPSGPVRIVHPFPPGNANDTTLRLIAERLSQRWKQPVTIDNRPGASSMIGTTFVAQAPADGLTLLANITLIVQNPALRPKLPYDPAKIVPVTQINRQQLSFYVRSDLGIDSATQLFALAKAQPGKINFASWGIASTAHIILAKMEQDQGIKMTHVPYKGGADIVKALASGEADIAVGDLITPSAFFKNGKFKLLAVTGPKRVAHLPDVPTLEEVGVKGFEGYNWLGLFAPAGTSPAIIKKISDDIAAVQSDPALLARFRDEMFLDPTSTGPEEFEKIYQRDAATWTFLIKATGLKAE